MTIPHTAMEVLRSVFLMKGLATDLLHPRTCFRVTMECQGTRAVCTK